jgi:hypothetical protein
MVIPSFRIISLGASSLRYVHRQNPDGAFDSICVMCLRTISARKDESSRNFAERFHECSPDEPAQIVDWLSELPRKGVQEVVEMIHSRCEGCKAG